MFVQKPWLQGTRQGPWTGRLPVLFDQNVVVVEKFFSGASGCRASSSPPNPLSRPDGRGVGVL
jgi:hypothetical protein